MIRFKRRKVLKYLCNLLIYTSQKQLYLKPKETETWDLLAIKKIRFYWSPILFMASTSHIPQSILFEQYNNAGCVHTSFKEVTEIQSKYFLSLLSRIIFYICVKIPYLIGTSLEMTRSKSSCKLKSSFEN